MINIEIVEPAPPQLDTDLLIRAAQETLRLTSAVIEADLTILLAGDEQLQDYNRQFLGIDAPTDVLSFPSEVIDPETQTRYLGDIAISIPRAQSQASAGGHALQAEVQLLVVHGVLHLLGYDHLTDPEKERMWALQAQILTHLGCLLKMPE